VLILLGLPPQAFSPVPNPPVLSKSIVLPSLGFHHGGLYHQQDCLPWAFADTELGHLRDLHLLEKTPGIFNHGWQPLRLYKPGFLLAFSLSLELSLLCILPPGALPPCFIPRNPPPGLSKSIALPFMSLDSTGFPLLDHPQLAT
jgi:hypothetical protein